MTWALGIRGLFYCGFRKGFGVLQLRSQMSKCALRLERLICLGALTCSSMQGDVQSSSTFEFTERLASSTSETRGDLVTSFSIRKASLMKESLSPPLAFSKRFHTVSKRLLLQSASP
jgi:hypothetical protein